MTVRRRRTRVAARGSDLERHLRRLLGSAEEARDVLGEVWITVRWRPPDGGPDRAARAGLYRLATDRALDRLAMRLGSRPQGRVRDGVSELPREQRDAAWMRWIEGLGYEEIAERLECSPETARANAYDGMKRLRSALFDGREPPPRWPDGDRREFTPGVPDADDGRSPTGAFDRVGRVSKSDRRARLHRERRERS